VGFFERLFGRRRGSGGFGSRRGDPTPYLYNQPLGGGPDGPPSPDQQVQAGGVDAGQAAADAASGQAQATGETVGDAVSDAAADVGGGDSGGGDSGGGDSGGGDSGGGGGD
jgi:hypothetical protein